MVTSQTRLRLKIFRNFSTAFIRLSKGSRKSLNFLVFSISSSKRVDPTCYFSKECFFRANLKVKHCLLFLCIPDTPQTMRWLVTQAVIDNRILCPACRWSNVPPRTTSLYCPSSTSVLGTQQSIASMRWQSGDDSVGAAAFKVMIGSALAPFFVLFAFNSCRASTAVYVDRRDVC